MKEYHSLSPGGGGTHTHSGPRSAVMFRLMRSCILQGQQGRSVVSWPGELLGQQPPRSRAACCRILECPPSRLCLKNQMPRQHRRRHNRQHGTRYQGGAECVPRAEAGRR